ncbi:ABC transporter permease [Candidatus Gracilibacteria bacterium]|nr:ABC transporter permease [Candidatus Gracilibacteria bacterium]NJS41058.1 ABC transporter permease [Candidatus Gracilibacteria bacterium]
MSLQAVLLILYKYFKENWLRIILASGGIIIGVWSITLTSFLSLGLSEKIITAINSQSATKYIQVQKDESGANSFFEISGPPKFQRISPNSVKADTVNIDSVQEVAANSTFLSYLRTSSNDPIECVNNLYATLDQPDESQLIPGEQPINPQTAAENSDGCYLINQNYGSFENLYQANKTDWIGQETPPTANEVVACYQCNPSSPLFEELSLASPQELLGQTLTLEYVKTPIHEPAGSIFDVTNPGITEYNFEETQTFEVKVAAVIDDRDSSDGGFAGANNFFTSRAIQQQASIVTPESVDFDNAGFIAIDVFIDDFQSLDSTIEDLQDKNYLVSSAAQLFITAVQSLFLVVTIVLGLFGLIALIASIFGITNVMAISVLKRQKEIGILKALGARNWDILKIFFLESTLLGIVGWIIGTLVGYLSTLALSVSFERFVLSNDSWRNNLENFGITDFVLPINYVIILATFVIALIITSISGILPAIRASRQDPVQTLKN